MNTLTRVPAVFLFEWRRVLTFYRIAGMALLALFPPLLLMLIRMSAPRPVPFEIASVILFALSPCVACMMTVFLIASPAIASELEGRSWVYLAVRPHGPLSVLIGKYLVAVSWGLTVGVVSATLGAIAIGAPEAIRLIAVQWLLVILSSIGYASAFLFLGVLTPKRAMIAGIVYAVILEVVGGFVPAAVNLLTFQHRLRCILVRCLEIDVEMAGRNPVYLAYFGEEPAIWHIVVLLLMAAVYLVAAAVLLRFREFTAAAETDI